MLSLRFPELLLVFRRRRKNDGSGSNELDWLGWTALVFRNGFEGAFVSFMAALNLKLASPKLHCDDKKNGRNTHEKHMYFIGYR